MSNVGIVFVSHSEQIALGLKELTTQAIQNVSIEAAGGTSMIIVVGVALETMKQLESQLVKRHYKGFMK